SGRPQRREHHGGAVPRGVRERKAVGAHRHRRCGPERRPFRLATRGLHRLRSPVAHRLHRLLRADGLERRGGVSAPAETRRSFTERMLDGVERLGNKVPHPVMMFLYLIAIVAVLSAILAWVGVSVTEEIVVPVPIELLRDLHHALGGSIVPYDTYTNQIVTLPDYTVQEVTIQVRSLLDVEGIRFMLTSFVANFAGFGVVAVTFVAMAGVGVAEHAGLMG